MPRAPVALYALPFVPAVLGLCLGVWRFREHDPLTGLAAVLGGVLAMVIVVMRLPGAR
jgi:hypothetical protein